jgi:hypothetical protein
MRRRFLVRLTGSVPAGKKSRGRGRRAVTKSIAVTVYQVTLGGFIEALRVATEHVFRFQDVVKKGAEMTQHDVNLALLHPEVCKAVADVLCPDMPRGWFEPWHSQGNIQRMLDAASKTSDWKRLIGELDFSGGAAAAAEAGGKGGRKPKKARKRRGTLYTDAILVSRILGVNPAEVIDGWTMERFLDVTDALVRSKEAAEEEQLLSDPTMDPDAAPSPLIPGMGKQWVN